MIAERLEERGRSVIVKNASGVQISEILASGLISSAQVLRLPLSYAELACVFKGVNLAGSDHSHAQGCITPTEESAWLEVIGAKENNLKNIWMCGFRWAPLRASRG